MILPENAEQNHIFEELESRLLPSQNKVWQGLKTAIYEAENDLSAADSLEELLTETKAEMNDILVESELDRMTAQMRSDVSRFGGTWEEYLKHAKKTEAELRVDWRKDAERRALTQLMLHAIAKKENIAPTEAEIDVELVRLMAHIKDADEERARAYLHQALTNEKVLAFLEKSA